MASAAGGLAGPLGAGTAFGEGGYWRSAPFPREAELHRGAALWGGPQPDAFHQALQKTPASINGAWFFVRARIVQRRHRRCPIARPVARAADRRARGCLRRAVGWHCSFSRVSHHIGRLAPLLN